MIPVIVEKKNNIEYILYKNPKLEVFLSQWFIYLFTFKSVTQMTEADFLSASPLQVAAMVRAKSGWRLEFCTGLPRRRKGPSVCTILY